MPRAISDYSPLGAFEHHFEEVPLLWKQVAAGLCWYGGYVDITVEVTYEDRHQWDISAVWITVDNGRAGAKCQMNHLYIHPKDNPYLYTMLVDSVIAAHSSRIEEMIEDELFAEAA